MVTGYSQGRSFMGVRRRPIANLLARKIRQRRQIYLGVDPGSVSAPVARNFTNLAQRRAVLEHRRSEAVPDNA